VRVVVAPRVAGGLRGVRGGIGRGIGRRVRGGIGRRIGRRIGRGIGRGLRRSHGRRSTRGPFGGGLIRVGGRRGGWRGGRGSLDLGPATGRRGRVGGDRRGRGLLVPTLKLREHRLAEVLGRREAVVGRGGVRG